MPGSRLVALAVLFAATTQTSPPSSSGLIVGQVVDAGNGRPIAGAVVSIAGPPARQMPPMRGSLSDPPPPPPRILTGTDGRFVFRDLARGPHTITVTRNGYADGAYGRRRPGGPSRPLTLEAGERVGDVTIRMWRHGAITGTVVDEAGEPAVGLMIRAVRSTVIAGRRRFAGGATAITDDRGVYRLGYLTPGDYLVSAPVRQVAMPLESARELAATGAQMRFDGGVTVGVPGTASVIQARDTAFLLSGGAVPIVANDGRLFVYPTTYYPSATAANQATPVTVGSGEERSAIDFQLRPVTTASVSGTLLGPEGPQTQIAVRLWPADADERSIEQEGLSALTNRSGAFTFPAVPTGNYVLRVQVRPRIPGLASVATGGGAVRSSGGESVYPLLWAELPVAVGRTDVTDLTVSLKQGLRVSGRVEFEGGMGRLGPMQLQQIPIVVEPAEGNASFSTPPSAVEMNGQFVTTGHVPGRYLLRVTNSPAGWMFKSATVGGRDIADVPFDLDTDISGVVVTFTNRWTGVQGAVRTREGTPDADATVVVFPVQPESWAGYGLTPRRIKSARTTASGTYAVNSVPPGEYFVAALPEEQSADWQDPRFLEALSRLAARVTVVDGEKATENLVTRAVR